MIIGLMICLALLIVTVGYLLFTQKYVYVQHSLLLSDSPEALIDKVKEIEFWSSWLPWSLYDDETTVQVSPAQGNETIGASIRLKGPHLKSISCHVTGLDLKDGLSFSIVSDYFYPAPIQVKITWTSTEEEQGMMQLHASSQLNMWQRIIHGRFQKTLYADMRLLLLRLKAQLVPESDANVQLTQNGCHKLPNVDAVTRPFIVSDHPMSVQMEQGFRDLIISLGPENRPAGPSFALYEDADIRQHYFTGKLGIPIQCLSACEAQPERLAFVGKYMSLKYQGSYQHLWLAWHTLHTYCRIHGLRPANRRTSLEVYEVSPRETSNTLQFVTVLYLPIL